MFAMKRGQGPKKARLGSVKEEGAPAHFPELRPVVRFVPSMAKDEPLLSPGPGTLTAKAQKCFLEELVFRLPHPSLSDSYAQGMDPKARQYLGDFRSSVHALLNQLDAAGTAMPKGDASSSSSGAREGPSQFVVGAVVLGSGERAGILMILNEEEDAPP